MIVIRLINIFVTSKLCWKLIWLVNINKKHHLIIVKIVTASCQCCFKLNRSTINNGPYIILYCPHLKEKLYVKDFSSYSLMNESWDKDSHPKIRKMQRLLSSTVVLLFFFLKKKERKRKKQSISVAVQLLNLWTIMYPFDHPLQLLDKD